MKLRQFLLKKKAPSTLRFFLNLTSPSNCTLANTQAIGTMPRRVGNLPSTVQFFLNLTSPTNCTLANTQAIGTMPRSASSLIVPSIVASRTSGVAPLLVHFDASGTTAASMTANPFHELEYKWNFGDSGAGSWGFGIRALLGLATLKNTDYGPIAAHVYDTPGTYVVSLGTRYDNNIATPITTTITVQDPNVVFAGTKTICISTSGNFTGAPSGAQLVTTASVATINSYLLPGNRVLLCRGETWTTATSVWINTYGTQPGHLGAYGSGAKPLISVTASTAGVQISDYGTTQINDWRITDIEVYGGDLNGTGSASFYHGGPGNNTLFLRCKSSKSKYGFHANNTHPSGIFQDVFGIIDCDIGELSGIGSLGGNGMYVGGERLVLMGNKVNTNKYQEHGIRTYFSNRAVYSHNTVQDPAAGKAHISVRAPLASGDPLGNLAYLAEGGVVYTDKIIIRDNYTFNTDGTPASVGAGPVNQTVGIGVARNVIIENNFGLATSFNIGGGYFHTIRNNISIGRPSNGLFTGIEHQYAQADITNIWEYNNSVYSSDSSYQTVLFQIVGDPMPGASGTFKNNLIYSPNRAASGNNICQVGTSGFAATVAGNSTDVQVNPLFTTNPPTLPAHMKPTVGSPAINAGVLVPVWSDFFETPVTGNTRDMGAIKS